MTRVTICPHLLVDYNMANPDDIEEYIIAPLREMLDAAQSLKIQVELSEHIIESMREAFPWDRMTDSRWKGYILEWSALIQTYIERKVVIVSHDIPLVNQTLVCNGVNQHINDLFVNFLNTFIIDRFSQTYYAEGIISTDICGNNISYKNSFSVKNENDLLHVKYPWLRTYDPRLPYSGQHPFIPDPNWKMSPTPIRGLGPKYGYKDINGHFWAWDTLHDNHWDVQMGIGVGNYMNISPSGKIL